MSKPLSGIRVIDVTELLPGPFATQNLVDLGAEVIKIERARGDNARNMFTGIFNCANRGKKSLTLNLKKPEAQELLHKLIKDADIFIEGYRPGVVNRLGIDYDTLSAINPGLIYASVSGFGQSGPEKDVPGHDLNYLAMAGVLSVSGTPDSDPMYTGGVPVADLAGSMYAVNSILAALLQRHQTGKGQYLDVAISDAILSWMGPRLAAKEFDPSITKRNFLARPAYGVYQTRDKQFIALAALEEHFWVSLVKLLDLTEFAGDEYLALPKREQCYEAIEAVLKTHFLSQDMAHWLKVLAENDIPVTVVSELDNVVEQPHYVARNCFGKSDAGNFVKYPVPMENLEPYAQKIPTVGEHNQELLAELNYSDEQIAELKKIGAV